MTTLVTPVAIAAANVRRWNLQSLGGRLLDLCRTVLCNCLRPWFPRIHAKLKRCKTVRFTEEADVEFAKRCKERVTTSLHSLRMLLADSDRHQREGSRIPDDILLLARDVVGQCVNFIDLCDTFVSEARKPFLSSVKQQQSQQQQHDYYGNSSPTGGAIPPPQSRDLLLSGTDMDFLYNTPHYSSSSTNARPVTGFFYHKEATNFGETRRPKINVASRARTPPPSSSSPSRSRQQQQQQQQHWMNKLPPQDPHDPVDAVTNNRMSIPPSFSPSPRRGGEATEHGTAHIDFGKRRVCKQLDVPVDWLSDPNRLSPRQRSSIEGAVRQVVNRPELSDEDRMWLVSTMRRLRVDEELSMPH